MNEIKVYLNSVEIASTVFQSDNIEIIERNAIHTFIKEIDDLVGKDNWTSFEYVKKAAE